MYGGRTLGELGVELAKANTERIEQRDAGHGEGTFLLLLVFWGGCGQQQR